MEICSDTLDFYLFEKQVYICHWNEICCQVMLLNKDAVCFMELMSSGLYSIMDNLLNLFGFF